MSQKLQEKTPIVPYAKVMDPIQEFNVLTTVVGVVEKGSLLDIQLYDNSLQPLIPPDRISYPCLPITCINTETGYCAEDAPPLSFPKCHEIFRNTIGQSESVSWKQER